MNQALLLWYYTEISTYFVAHKMSNFEGNTEHLPV